MMMCGENDDSGTNLKNRKMNCQYQQNSLGLIQQGDKDNLKFEKILTLFEGSRENTEYFIGLCNCFNLRTNENNWSGEERPCVELNRNCDPRDERKSQYIKDWEPVVSFCPVGFGDEGKEAGDGDSSFTGVHEDGGDLELPAGSYAAKQTVLDPEDNEFLRQGNTDQSGELTVKGDVQRFPCGVAGCGQVLFSLANYESHYHHCHSHVCDACRRVFVSNFLLDIHLQENHDSYFAVLSPKIDMFRCLVESCDVKFRTPELRKDHLVSVHKFPSSFSFHQPVKSKRSNQVPHLSGPSKSDNGMDDTMDMEAGPLITGGKNSRENVNSSQTKKVPVTVCFGRGSQRAFQQRKGQGRGGSGKGRNRFWQTDGLGATEKSQSELDTSVAIESVDMMELADALT